MMWAIVILLGLIAWMMGVICYVVQQVQGEISRVSYNLNSFSDAAKEYFERENRKERYEIPTEEERKREEEREEKLRAETKWRIESEWGGWRKAMLVCRRQHGSYGLQNEYGFQTANRIFTVLAAKLPNSEGEYCNIGDEVEYFTRPERFAGKGFIIPDAKRGIAEFTLLEEKSREPENL